MHEQTELPAGTAALTVTAGKATRISPSNSPSQPSDSHSSDHFRMKLYLAPHRHSIHVISGSVLRSSVQLSLIATRLLAWSFWREAVGLSGCMKGTL